MGLLHTLRVVIKVSFKVNDKKPLKKYTKIWEKISSLMNKESNNEPVYGDSDKYIKTKIRFYKIK